MGVRLARVENAQERGLESHPPSVPALKLAVLQNIVAPTRHALFRALAERVDLTVLFMARSERAYAWQGREELDYAHEFLRGLHVPLPGRVDVDTAHLNPGIARALARGKYDALLCGGYLSPTTWLALAASRRADTRFLLWFGSARRGSAALEPLKRRFVAASDGYVAYGEAASRRLVSLGAAEERITVALNTTDVGAFAAASSQRDSARTELGLGDRRVLLWSGRLVARKRVDAAIDLAARIGDVELLVVGDGPQRKRLEEHALRVGARVRFLGERRYDELPRVYSAADALVTMAEDEPWGLVVNEALAAGLPVLAGPEVVAARELVPQGGGAIGTIAELAEAGERLLGDSAARQRAKQVLPAMLPERWADAVVAAAEAARATD